jgi:hypothetical protein
MRSYLQHCPIANHFAGNANDLPCCKINRANDGVNSGLSATLRSPLSEKLYNCVVISSPAFLVNSSSLSSTGASNSSNPKTFAHSRKCPNSHDRCRISSGGKSRVPFGGCRSIVARFAPRSLARVGSTVVVVRPPSPPRDDVARVRVPHARRGATLAPGVVAHARAHSRRALTARRAHNRALDATSRARIVDDARARRAVPLDRSRARASKLASSIDRRRETSSRGSIAERAIDRSSARSRARKI